MRSNLSAYFSGEKLYGDDFSASEIEAWFEKEKEGYADLGAKDIANYKYVYHKLNILHGFKYIRERSFSHALGLGGAHGHEFLPISPQINEITILDASTAFSDTNIIGETPCSYVMPNANGDFDFDDARFDLIVCLGVLHHIPNVTHVLNECFRCLQPGGVMLVREPIVSMGDWTRPRPGLTKCERGIPLELFAKIIEDCGFQTMRSSLCLFPHIHHIAKRFGIQTYNNEFLTRVDRLLSNSFSWNYIYHRTRFHQRFCACSVYIVLTK